MSEFEWTVPEPTQAIAPTGADVAQGGIGIFGDFRTRDDEDGELITTMLRFDEYTAASSGALAARDSCRGLDDLAPAVANYPPKALGAVGWAAQLNPTGPLAYVGKDLITGGTLHTRNVTVKALLQWDVAAQNAYGQDGTLIARGKGNSAAEYMPYAIELRVITPATRLAEVRFLWHDTAGVLKTQTGAQFVAPSSGYFLLTCTRRWVSPTEVVLRYYVNDRRIGEVTSVDGSIGGGTTGTTSIGARFTGAAYAKYLRADLDELAIANYEMTLEEIEATWLRISHYQPDGYRQILAQMPPGMPISDDPASKAQSDLRSIGQALGFGDAMIENHRQNLMPDRAYGRALRSWEFITEQPPEPGDSVDRRRARVCGHLAQGDGVSPDGVRAALEELLDCDGEDLEILAFDNTIRDDFAALRDQRWRYEPAAAFTVTGNTLRAQAAAGDFPWQPGIAPVGGKVAVIPFEQSRGLNPTAFAGLYLFGSVDLVALPANAEAGLVLWNWAGNTALWFGVRNVAGAYKVGYQRMSLGSVWAAGENFVELATTANTKHWFRLRPSDGDFALSITEEKWDLSWSTVGNAEAQLTTHAQLTALRTVGWAGYYIRSFGTTAGATDVRFAEHALRNVLGSRPFYLYVYRDPALGGNPDIEGANRVLRRLAHGFTNAAVITQKSLLCDNLECPIDRGPMGAL